VKHLQHVYHYKMGESSGGRCRSRRVGGGGASLFQAVPVIGLVFHPLISQTVRASLIIFM